MAINQSFAQDASGNISRPSSYTTGTLAALNAAVTLTVPEGDSSWDIYLSGTFSATSQVAFEGSLDNVNWFNLNGRRNTDSTTNDTTTTLDATPFGGSPPTGANPSNWRGNLGAIRFMRVRCSIYTAADSIAVQISTSVATGAVFLNASPPTPADRAGSGTIAALNAAVSASTVGCSTAVFNIQGTWLATLSFQGTIDGTNWFGILAQVPLSITTNITTSNNEFIIPCGGFSQVRVMASAYTSGTATITWESSAGTNVLQVANFTASGLQTTARLNDTAGNGITSNTNGSKQALDVNQADKTGSGTIAALNAAIVAQTAGTSNLSFNTTGTWVATIVIEASNDNTNWTIINGDIDINDTIASSFTTNTLVTIPSGGFSQIRLRASLYTSGTLTGTWSAGVGTSVIEVFNTTAGSLQATVVLSQTTSTGSSPTAATVGVSSGVVIATNANRKGLVLTNTSSSTISLNIAAGSAVLNSGITLFPGGVWVMDLMTFTTAAINGIASAASSNIAIQEMT